jgi:hypothetical protein
MVGFGLAVTGAGIVGGVFARSLVLDLVSFWPGLILVMLAAAALYPYHRGEWSRLAAIVPLLVLSWLGATIALHLSEWSVLPSAAADIEGPSAAGVDLADLTIVGGGELAVHFSPPEEPLYDVRMVRRGGSTAAARTFERVDPERAQITIDERERDTWFLTRGWRIRLNADVLWRVDLEATSIEADLSGGQIASLRLAGTGNVVLPTATGEVQVAVDGRFELEVPMGVGMVVSGDDVTVPASWIDDDGVWTSPGAAIGYTVQVTPGGAIVVREQ